MRNTNLTWVADNTKEIRRWIEYGVPGDRRDPERALDVDDLVQKVCLIAVEKLGKIPDDLGEAKVKAWLRSTCRNVTRRYRFKLMVAIVRFDRRDVVSLELRAQRTPPNEEVLRQVARSIWRYLSPQQRDVLRMWSEGYSPYEIAEVLKISLTTVYERRKEIYAIFEKHNGRSLAIFPPFIVGRLQAHPVGWAVGVVSAIAAAIAMIFWLVGSTDGGPSNLPSPTVVEEPQALGLSGNGTPPNSLHSSVAAIPSATSLTNPTPAPRPEEEDAIARISSKPNEPTSHTIRQPVGSHRGRPRQPKPPSGRLPLADAAPPTQEHIVASSLDPRELALFHDARISLRNGDPETALRMIQQHKVDFPVSSLAKGRMRLEHSTLCALGRLEDASIVERVLRTYHDPGHLRCDAPRHPKRSPTRHRTQTR